MEHLSYIEQYFDDQLTDAECRAFEERCKQDEAFAAQVKWYLYAQLAVRKSGHEDMKEKLLQQIAQDQIVVDTSSSSRLGKYGRYVWLAAASLVLLLVMRLIFWSNEQTYTPLALYDEYQTMPYYPVMRDESASEAPEVWNRIIMLYNAAQYEQVIAQIDILLTDDFKEKLGESNIVFVLGTSYLLTQQPVDAINLLKDIQPQSQWYNQAQWYLALAYLKTEQVEPAKITLSEIAQVPYHVKQKEAVEILKQLE